MKTLLLCFLTVTISCHKRGKKMTNLPLLKVTDNHFKKAIFAGGCFWCMEWAFERVKVVKKVSSGYCGGKKETESAKVELPGRSGRSSADPGGRGGGARFPRSHPERPLTPLPTATRARPPEPGRGRPPGRFHSRHFGG